jgi:hypothetical protein
MLREVLDRFESLTAIPWIVDKGYDAVDRIAKLKALGCEPAIAMKEWRVKIKHPLRKLSQRGWEKYGRRYRIEGVFGSTKQKLGSFFRLVREDLAIKRALGCAVLYNFYMLTGLLYFYLSVLGFFQLQHSLKRDFLEQPPTHC